MAPATILGTTEADQALNALGVQRLAIPVPFVQAGGPVNVYLIEDPDGSLTLFDAGLGSAEAEKALALGFAEAGRRMQDVRLIVVSHGHVDHYGAARTLVERSGASVRVHPRDAWKVLLDSDRPQRLASLHAYLRELGMPGEEIAEVAAIYRAHDQVARRLERADPVEEGHRFRFKAFEAQALHAPGHTPGLICLHVPERRLLFSDDHLLARVSPNPLLEAERDGAAGRFRALEAYLESARRVHALDLDWVLPGHGPPFQDHRTTLDSLFRFYRRRQERILSLLQDGPKTAWELIPGVFGAFRPSEGFLMLSEVVGNLEVLESQGAVRRLEGRRPLSFERT